jgi:hypothetical protein
MSAENAKNLFQVASRKKYRWDTAKGQITVEDLWDLKLADLDRIAVALDDKVLKAGGKSFISTPKPGAVEDKDKLDIVVEVIAIKVAEAEARKTAAEKAQRADLYRQLIEKKKMEQLEGMSIAELEKAAAEL